MAQDSSNEGYQPTLSRFKKGLGKRLVLGAAAGLLAGKLYTTIQNNSENNSYNPPTYVTYDLHDSALVSNWDEKLQAALKTGSEVRIADLIIKVPANQTLKARYSPSVIPPRDGTTGNLAVEFEPGVEFTVDNALMVDGDYSDVNDRSSNRWAWIDGKGVGLEHDIFINLGDSNSKFVTDESTERGVIQGTDPQGNIFVTNDGEVNLAPGIITFNLPAKAIGPKK